jgi:hypothetical protein
VRAARDFERKHTPLGQENVALESASLVLRAYLIAYAGDSHVVRARNYCLYEDDIVEL